MKRDILHVKRALNEKSPDTRHTDTRTHVLQISFLGMKRALPYMKRDLLHMKGVLVYTKKVLLQDTHVLLNHFLDIKRALLQMKRGLFHMKRALLYMEKVLLQDERTQAPTYSCISSLTHVVE